MSATLCQITADYLDPPSAPALMRALQVALGRFLAVYVAHTPNLGWELSQVCLCVSQGRQANQADIQAWLALPEEQRNTELTRVLSAQTRLVCAHPILQLRETAPANPERSITVYLPSRHGGVELRFEFPGDFCCLPTAAGGAV